MLVRMAACTSTVDTDEQQQGDKKYFNDPLRYPAAKCSPTFLPPVAYKGTGNLVWPVIDSRDITVLFLKDLFVYLFIFQTQFQLG